MRCFIIFRGAIFAKNKAQHSQHTVDDTTSEFIKKIPDLVMEDRRLKIRELSSVVDISSDSILHQHLKLKKLSARWVSFDEKDII